MTIEFTDKEFRRLLDLVYIGNWVLNAPRLEDERFSDYDDVQEKVFSKCASLGMRNLYSTWYGHVFPSRAFEDGGIHDAIEEYENSVFFDILAEELSRRDLTRDGKDPDDYDELGAKIEEYMTEFEQNGIDNLTLEA